METRLRSWNRSVKHEKLIEYLLYCTRRCAHFGNNVLCIFVAVCRLSKGVARNYRKYLEWRALRQWLTANRKLRIWSHLLKKFLMENFIFCAVCCKAVYLRYLRGTRPRCRSSHQKCSVKKIFLEISQIS